MNKNIFVSVLFLILIIIVNGSIQKNFIYSNVSDNKFNSENSVCDYSWSAQNSGTSVNLLSVSAVSELTGWVAGEGGIVRKTINGGLTWTNGNSNPGVISGDIYNIYAWTASDAVCTTTPGDTYIYKTSDGGNSWIQVYSLQGGYINALHMVSSTEGYGVGDPLSGKWTILKTTDGGNSWIRMLTEPPVIGTDAGWNNSFLIVGNNMWFGTNGTKVYHSTDLGLTWSFGVTTGTANTFALHFNSLSEGLAGGNALVISTNGGTSYSTVPAPGLTGNLNGLDGDGTDWWALRADANIYRSTNNAVSWTNAFTLPGAVFNDIDIELISGCPKGWVAGNNGIIAKMSLINEIENINNEIPSGYKLMQNFPNPFNPETDINYSIPVTGFVSLKVFDLKGREVAVIVNEVKPAGNYIAGFNASGLPSGTYFYKMETDNFNFTRKMLLIK